jgi:hypothetical protein
MERSKIISIIKGYENQLANAEIKQDAEQITFLKAQISEANKSLGTMAIGYDEEEEIDPQQEDRDNDYDYQNERESNFNNVWK